MKHKHVKRLFHAWSEKRVGEDERREVEQHLEECADCRLYFDRMSALLQKLDPSLLPRLEADPFLPTRIRAQAGGAGEASALPARARAVWPRFSVLSAVLVAALAVGVFLGRGLSKVVATSAQQDDSDIVEAYYSAFSQSGFASDWESVISDDEEENS